MGAGQSDPSLRLAYVEQIKRDMAVLKEDPIYYATPGRRFYETRIREFRNAILSMNSSPAGASGGKPAIPRSIPRVWVRLKRRKR